MRSRQCVCVCVCVCVGVSVRIYAWVIGSYLSNMIGADDDITADKLAQPSASSISTYGGSTSLATKVAVYRAVVLTSLLYGSETWTLFRYQFCRLDQFHLLCLRSIAGIKWQDRISNTEVVRTCGVFCFGHSFDRLDTS